MHEIYRTFADDLHRERLREADRERLAKQVRRDESATVTARVRGFLAGLLGQPAPAATPTFSSDPRAGGS
jgi:hypothetical protein